MSDSKKVIVYSTPDCAYCYTLKNFLQSKGIEYTEINIYTDEKARQEMEALSGQNSVPVTVIDGKVVIGWDKVAIDDLLKNIT